MSIFPPGDVWTGAEVAQAFTACVVPLSACAVGLNLIGVSAFYSFKKHRKFPASIIAWIGIVNCIYYSYLIAKWAPNSVSSEAIAYYPNSAICSFSLWIDSYFFYSLVTLNTLIAFTLYLSVSRRVDLDYETHPKYFWGYIGFYWLVVIVAPIAITKAPGNFFANGVCNTSLTTTYAEFAPEFVMILFQLFCVISAFINAGVIISAAKSTSRTKNDIRLLYMMIRFAATIFSQLLGALPYYVLEYTEEFTKASLIKAVCVCIPLGAMLDGCILIFSNRPLMRLLWRKMHLKDSDSYSSSSGKSTQMQRPTNTTTNSVPTLTNSGGV